MMSSESGSRWRTSPSIWKGTALTIANSTRLTSAELRAQLSQRAVPWRQFAIGGINTVVVLLAYCVVVAISVWTLCLAVRKNQSAEAKSRTIAYKAYAIPAQGLKFRIRQ